jgi:hypothetical protein
MNFPNLPTDNLYKFCALAGLIATILSIVLPNIALHNLNLELIKTNGEIKVLEAESRHFKAAENKDNLSPEEKTNLLEKSKELEIKLIQLNSKNDAENFLTAQARHWRSIGFFGVFLGVLLVATGFILWYRKVQIYQDMILKKEAGGVSGGEKNTTVLAPDSSPPPVAKDS